VVAVTVALIGIGDVRAVVAGVADAVAILIVLSRICNIGAVVGGIGNAIAVAIAIARRRLPGIDCDVRWGRVRRARIIRRLRRQRLESTT
jgi:hypothetical protein